MLHLSFFAALLIGSCGYAIWHGGAPERIVGIALLIAAAASTIGLSQIPTRFFEVELNVLVVDSALLLILLAVALLADRAWPLLLAGLQLSTVGAHLVKLVDVNMIRVTYALAIAIWSYPMVLALAVGTWRHGKRLRATGYDRAWAVRESVSTAAA